MAINESKTSKRLHYLEEEREKLWYRVVELEKLVSEKPSDFEKQAKQASRKTAEYRNKSELRLKEANEIYSKISKLEDDIKNTFEEVRIKYDNILETSSDLLEKREELSSSLKIITKALNDYPYIDDEIEKLDNLVRSIEENSSKANSTYKGILSKKNEIDELHREILGYQDEDEEGELVPIDGQKQELEKAYDKIKHRSESLVVRLDELQDSSEKKFEEFIKENQEDLKSLKTNSQEEYDKINKKIESLLPNALTAGLSSAFVTKKGEEELLYKEYKNSFDKGILYISLSALIPIGISVFYLLSGATLRDTIERAPKVMLAFLPLYIPLIWTTISANIKVNLSKRLIEEYSHKQVLSMTIEGLSKQIENIEDSDISEELRVKLLRSFLEVTNENPGKLISNYQKSDNPIMNLFDRGKKEKSYPEKVIDKAEKEFDEVVI